MPLRNGRGLCRPGGSPRKGVQGFGREGCCARGTPRRIRAYVARRRRRRLHFCRWRRGCDAAEPLSPHRGRGGCRHGDIMSRIPDFSNLPFAATSNSTDAELRNWATPEGLEVKSFYGPRDRDGLDLSSDWPGLRPFEGRIRPCTSRSPGRLRQYAGFSTAEESNAFYRANLAGGTKGPLRRVRPRDASPLRFRSSARCGATSAWRVSRSIPFMTCAHCFPASRSIR